MKSMLDKVLKGAILVALTFGLGLPTVNAEDFPSKSINYIIRMHYYSIFII